MKDQGPGSHRGRELRRLALTIVAFAGSGLTTLVFNLALIHALDRIQYGAVARSYALAMAIAQVVMAGGVPALARIVARPDSDAERLARAEAAIRQVLRGSALLALAYVPLAVAGFAGGGGRVIAWGALLVVVYPAYFAGKVFLLVLDRVEQYAWLELSSDCVFGLALAMCLTLSPSDGLVAFSIAYGLFLVRLRRQLGMRMTSVPIGRGDVRFGFLSLIGTYAAAARFPLVITATGWVANNAAAAGIAAVLSVVMPTLLVPQAASMLAFADVAREGLAAAQSVRRSAIAVAGIAGWTIATAMVLAEPLTRVLLGSRYEGTAASFVIVLVGMSVFVSVMPLADALAAAGRAGLNAAASFLGLAVAILGVVLAASRDDFSAVAIVVSASLALSAIVIVPMSHRCFGFGFAALMTGAALPVMAGAVLLFAGSSLAVAVLIIGLGAPFSAFAARAAVRVVPRSWPRLEGAV